MGHKLAERLKENGTLAPLIRHGLAGRRGRFRRVIRALGGEFRSTYEENRAAGLDKRQSSN